MDETVSQDYIDTNLVVAENQLVLCGYRLAYVMEYIFPTQAELFLQ